MASFTEVDPLLELRDWLRTGRAREIREAAKLSRPVIARQLGVHVRSVLNWEMGYALPHAERARAYHELLTHLARKTAA